jgi:DNA-3-methyladenine glycosylase
MRPAQKVDPAQAAAKAAQARAMAAHDKARDKSHKKALDQAHSAQTRLSSDSPFTIRRLRREELPHDTVALARFLMGKVVVHDLACGRLSGRIVEAEAYPPGDPAGHHFRGPTPRIRSMYLAPGHAYVFFNYGAHFMLNVASEPEGQAGGILLRALEPLEGVECMRRNRGTEKLLELTSGPGRLAAALQIGREHDGVDLCAGRGKLWLGELVSGGAGKPRGGAIARAVRIGISRAADELLRFYERGNPFVSGPKRLLGVAKARRRRAGKTSGDV